MIGLALMMSDVNPLTITRGLIIAPAGCGKTHLITEALIEHTDEKPILILTHTNAGVAAIRQRLQKLAIPKSKYKLATIDGWAMRIVSTFPVRANYSSGANPKKPNYLKIRKACWRVLKKGHLTDILKASYSRIIVDEYQDCSHNQHAIVYFAANHLPACILADPMQAIFGFGNDPLADWDEHVCKHFPQKGELTKPWRWINEKNEELGEWLLKVRTKLLNGEVVDLNQAPASVRWVELQGDQEDHNKLVDAARCIHKAKGETSLVIGDSRSEKSRFRIAKRVPGIITVEPVSLIDLTNFASRLCLGDGYSVRETLNFASSVLTNIDVEGTMARLKTIKSNRARNPATDMELAALRLEEFPTLSNVANLLSSCTKQTECRNYRPAVLKACMKAITMSSADDKNFEDAAVQVREENRAIGRQLPQSAIGSTLLLKGLEADHVVVLNADDLDAKNLYVAMTRGAKTVTICSKTTNLNF